MIKRLDIENLRSFRGKTSVELAPITLIYGPNSAGKSTLMKALALLRQTLAFGQVDRPGLVLEGDVVDLGSFRNAVHKHDITLPLYVGLQFEDPQGAVQRFTDDQLSVYAGVGFGYDAGAVGGAIQRSATLGDGRYNVNFKRPATGPDFVLERGDELLSLIGTRAEAYASAGEEDDAKAARVMQDELRKMVESRKPLEFMGSGFFPALPVPGHLENHETDKAFATWFEEAIFDRVAALGDLMAGFSYLGPLRAAPSRFQVLRHPDARRTDVGPTGENVTRLLLENVGGVLDRVNDWLQYLEIDYILDVGRVRGDGLAIEIGDLVATALLHTNGGTPVTPQDVGFGISQLLPVVVQLVASQRSTICIEQPEIHIHPRLQAAIGDLIVEAAAPARKNQLIIETHSEHLFLRLKNWVEHAGTHPNTFGSWLSPEGLAVIYVDVDRTEGHAAPKRLRLDERGRLLDEWPGGFFDEREKELYLWRPGPVPSRVEGGQE